MNATPLGRIKKHEDRYKTAKELYEDHINDSRPPDLRCEDLRMFGYVVYSILGS